MVDPAVLSGVQRYLRSLDDSGLGVRFGVLFGSRARGGGGPSSDIDVLVVSPRFDPPRARSDVDRLWRVAARTDSRIEPIPCGERQWEEDATSTIIEVARREGVRVTLADHDVA